MNEKENTEYRNSGHHNSGYQNSGDYNSGDYSSGHWNTGHRNSGHQNSGHYNSGDYNSGDWNSGFFNSDEPTVRMFNKCTGLTRDQIIIPFIDLKLNEWIASEKMTPDQKHKNPNYKTTGGFLLTRTYKEAWDKFWKECDQKIKEQILELPNFDSEIFFEITGIRVDKKRCCCCKCRQDDFGS